MTKQFTQEQHRLLESLVLDADMLGLSDKEGISYIQQKIGKHISQSTYSRCKRKVFSDNEIKLYYKNYAKIGLLKFYKERMNEMQRIHQETYKMWFREINKKEDEQDKKLILDLVNVLRTNSQYLGNLSISLPPMAEIGNILDEQQEKIRQLNENIQRIYRKHIGFIIKKEMEYDKKSNNDDDDVISQLPLEQSDTNTRDKENEHSNPPITSKNLNLAEDFIKECVENEIVDNSDNSHDDSIKLAKDMREQLKKEIEIYQHIKKLQKESVFY